MEVPKKFAKTGWVPPVISASNPVFKNIRTFLNGAVFGVMLIVPGVSATIFAILLGFYNELINAMNHFREDYRKNAIYLGVFLLGIAAGAIVFSHVIMFLLDNHSLPTMLFFMGLLLGVVPLIARKAKGTAPRIALREIVLTLLSMFALVALSLGVTTTEVNPEYAADSLNVALILFIFLAGIINGATLVIPGFSGAFILLIMGLYPLVISSISSIGDLFVDLSNLALLRDISIVLLPFAFGAIIGCIGMARLMEKLMRDFHESVHAVILGFILGSVITLILDHLVIRGVMPVVVGVVMLCAGCAVSYILGKKAAHGH